jgi:hypothetical protein
VGILANYDIIIEHRPGTTNRADPLSRCPDYDDGSRDNQNVIVLPDKLFAHVADLTDIKNAVIDAQHHHQSTLTAWSFTYPQMELRDNLWWNSDRLVVMEDHILRRGVTSLYHDFPTTGHPGALKTCLMIAKDFWWPKLGLFVQDYVKGCATCQATKATTNKPKPPLYPITTEPTALPFEYVSVDLIVKLPPSQGYDSILTVTDHGCSKAAIMIPCHEATDVQGMAQLYGRHVFPHFGIPKSIISDRDPRFIANFTRELCHILSV